MIAVGIDSFYLTKTEILRVSDSSWRSGNNFCSSLHSQNPTTLDCFNSYTHCKIYIYLVISTFANRNVLRKFFNHSSCSFRQFLPFETRLSSQLRRAINFARVHCKLKRAETTPKMGPKR